MNKIIIVLTLLAISATASQAADFSVGQKNKQFSHKSLNIKVGDRVHFPNHDPFFHNIYSLSEISSFDLGSYPAGESRSFTFKKPGIVEIECAIHPRMYLEVSVTK